MHIYGGGWAGHTVQVRLRRWFTPWCCCYYSPLYHIYNADPPDLIFVNRPRQCCCWVNISCSLYISLMKCGQSKFTFCKSSQNWNSSKFWVNLSPDWWSVGDKMNVCPECAAIKCFTSSSQTFIQGGTLGHTVMTCSFFLVSYPTR